MRPTLVYTAVMACCAVWLRRCRRPAFALKMRWREFLRYRNGLICAGLVLCCVAIYGQTLAHDFILYDDPLYVTQNPEVQAGLSWANVGWALTTDRAMYMHPLTWMSHMLDCDLYGLRPWGHHLTNLIFHALGTVLLFLVLARMTGRGWPSALVAALFAVHPLHVESVAWVAERKDVLSMVFWTAGLGAYAWHRQRPGVGRYAATTVLFLLGFMSKPMVVTFPFVLLLLDCWPLGRVDKTAPFGAMTRQLARLALEKTPLFLLGALMCAVTLAMQIRANNLVFMAEVPFASRCANALVVYVLYLIKTIWPSGLAVYYPHPIMRPEWQVAGAALVLFAVTAVSIREFRRRPYLAVGWFWYLGTLVPVIELVQAGTFSHADRYTYIPLIGIFIMAAWGLDELRQSGRVPAAAVTCVATAMVAAFTLAAAIQAGHWKDTETLFRHALEVTSENSFSVDTFANGLYANKKREESLEQLHRALKLDPLNVLAIEHLAVFLQDQEDYEAAAAKHGEALMIKPDFALARDNLRRALKKLNTLDALESERQELLKKQTKSLDELCRLGVIAMTLGEIKEASGYFDQTVRMEPSGRKTNLAIGSLLLKDKLYDKALPFYQKALQTAPNDPYALYNAGLILSALDRTAEAADKYRQVLRINPSFVQAHNNLGILLAGSGHPDEATEHFLKVIALDPEHSVQTRVNLANMLVENHRSAEAETQLRKALETDPGNADALKLLNQIESENPSAPASERKAP